MTERTTQLIIVLGYNGTGKTTLIKKMIAESLKNGRRVLIVTPDDIEFLTIPVVHPKFTHHLRTYTGARRMIYEDKDTLHSIINHFSNGLLIFDDCRAYFTAALDKELHELLIRRRQKMLDIVAVGHGFTEVPPKFFTFASKVILFRTNDNIDRRKDVLKDFQKMAFYQEKINKEAETSPHVYTIIDQL
ncbi:MAG: ATP-binding protein [Chlorobi bacterium]|nr:ATP-binding protein [Chlorobiota bacterium]